jgi:hypothetical protein
MAVGAFLETLLLRMGPCFRADWAFLSYWPMVLICFLVVLIVVVVIPKTVVCFYGVKHLGRRSFGVLMVDGS